MIYDHDWNPVNDNEYHQRLLATTILLVRAAGGSITIPEQMLRALANTGHKLNQTATPDGSILLTVEDVTLPVGDPS